MSPPSEPLRICVVTGSRADYGFLRWLMRSIEDGPDLHLQVIATGMHLQERQGSTLADIQADGFDVDAVVPFFTDDDSELGIARALGRGVSSIAEALAGLQPDRVVILGDRVEALAAALASHTLRIPIAHIHGGEVTQGALDDAYRHAITKLAHIHLPVAADYRSRIVQLGEEPQLVFDVGALAVESIQHTDLIEAAELERDLQIDVRNSLLFTYHPVTLENDYGFRGLEESLKALEQFPQLSVVMTYPNSDSNGIEFARRIEGFATRYANRVTCVPNLGQRRYISLLSVCRAVVGNSSSALIEAAITGTPAVDIGSRQLGRLRPSNVIHAEPEEGEISAAIMAAVSPEFREVCRTTSHPFGDGATSRRIARVLAGTQINRLDKHFHDVTPEEWQR